MSYREECEKLYIEHKEMKELIDWLWENEPEKTEMLDKIQKYLKQKGVNGPSDRLTLEPLVIPLVDGVEEFWGYFEDSEGHIWHVKASKTGQRKEK